MDFNGTFFVTIISFLVFVYLMNKILYAPMRKIINERRSFIENNYSTASECDKKAEQLINEKNEKLVSAKNDARKRYTDLLNNFKAEKTEIIQNAQTKADENTQQAFENLNNISNETKEALKNSMNDLANDIVEKFIGYRSNSQNFDDDSINEILYSQEG